jgi:hypothetical protein
MGLSNLSFSATNLNVGNDADKPLYPKAGDIYVATDTKITYTCYKENIWTDESTTYSTGTYVGNNTANRAIPHGLSRAPSRIVLIRMSSGVGYVATYFKGLLHWGLWDNTASVAVSDIDADNFYVPQTSLNETDLTYKWFAYL